MTNEQYGEFESKRNLPSINLLRVPHRGEDLIVARFGPKTYGANIKEMQGEFSHNSKLGNFPEITFRPATTSESISAAAYKFEELAMPQIFNQTWLQIGWRFGTQEGIFLNPIDEQRNPIEDEKVLKRMLNGAEIVKGIYLARNDLVFVPYDTFKQGVQESEKFAESGLARGLEHTVESSAPNLKKISSKENYKLNVNVFGFNGDGLSVVGLGSDGCAGDRSLCVDGYWNDDGGYSFGVRDAEGTPRSARENYTLEDIESALENANLSGIKDLLLSKLQ